VNRAVGQMDDMTQQNAALVEQAAAAAASLHEQTVNLAHAVSIFRIEDSQDEAPAPQLPDHERRAPESPMRRRPALAHAHPVTEDQEDAPRPRRTANGR
jgi:methyl-accepting chemotaxis protein